MDLPVILTEEERDLISEQFNNLRRIHEKKVADYEHRIAMKTVTLTECKYQLIHHKHCIANIDVLLNKLEG